MISLSMMALVSASIGSEVEVGKNDLVGPKEEPLRRLRFLDLDDQLGRGPDFGGLADDRRAGGSVGRVGNATPLPRACLDQHRVARVGQLEGADRQHRDSVLVRLDLFGHADDHPLDLRSRWRNRPVERGCESRLLARAIRPDSSPNIKAARPLGQEMGELDC